MKNLSNLGKALNKAEQKNVFGGGPKIKHEGDPCDGIEGTAEDGCPCDEDAQCHGICNTNFPQGTSAGTCDHGYGNTPPN